MLGYFDLNNHIYKSSKAPMKTMTLPESVESEVSATLPLWKQGLMYLGVFIGVFFSAAVSQFKKGETITIPFDTPTLIISAIVAFVIMPSVYEKIRLDPKIPILIQFGVFVQNGVFWQVLFNSIGKVI